jgi:hypothetical protein
MRFLKVAIASVVMLAACGAPPNQASVNAPANTPSAAPTAQLASVQVAVDTTKNPCQQQLSVKAGTCYLPLYTRPSYSSPSMPINSAPGSKCTRTDESKCWPQPATQLTAVCQEDGDRVQNSEGTSDNIWYGVVIPAEEVLARNTLLPTTADGRKVGFAPKIWLSKQTAGELPQCGNLIPLG